MKWHENLKCTHAFILHSFPMIKGLPIISVLHPFGPWMNFRNYTWDSLPLKIISHLTMVCYHQNLIRRTLGLTLYHIVIFLKKLIKKGSLNIYLPNFVIQINYNWQEYLAGLKHDYWQKSFLIIKTKFLIITLHNKPCFQGFKLSIDSSLPLIDLLTLYGFYLFSCF